MVKEPSCASKPHPELLNHPSPALLLLLPLLWGRNGGGSDLKQHQSSPRRSCTPALLLDRFLGGQRQIPLSRICSQPRESPEAMGAEIKLEGKATGAERREKETRKHQ